MTNSTFWESYKAKCLEKGLPPLYENAEEFDKAMNEPKPYSSDDFTLTVKHSEPNAKLLTSNFCVIGNRKEIPLLKEPVETGVFMKEGVLHEVIVMAYKRGVMVGKYEVLGAS